MLDGKEIVDSFRKKLDNTPDCPDKIWEIIDFANIYTDSYGSLILPLLDHGMEISKRIGYKAGEVIVGYNYSFLLMLSGGLTPTNSYYDQKYIDDLLEEIKDDNRAYTYALSFKAYSHWFKGEFDKGFDIIFNTLKITPPEYSTNMGWLYYALGVFYFDTKDFDNSELYYTRAMQNFEAADYIYGAIRSKTGIGTVAIVKKEADKAAAYLTEAAKVYRELSHSAGLSRALNDLGTLEFQKKNYNKALELLSESVKLREQLKHYQGLITTYTAIGEVNLALGKKSEAKDYFTRALDLAIKINAKQKRSGLHRLLANLYKETGDIASAYEHLEAYHEISSSLMGVESTNNIKRIQTNFEKEKAEQIAEIEKQKNAELQKAYAEIESKNKDINDSINYAKRIQYGILPADADIEKCFNDFFVLYLPKDIVSGDFYWAVKGTSQKTGDTVSIIAAIDCTGHGVPGAFMSMLGNTLLNQTIFDPNVIYPSDVLNYLNRELPRNLRSQENADIKDGMDMALCSFNFDKMKLLFAGANNPCWIVRDKQLEELKADKHPISASAGADKPSFTDKEYTIKKGDMVYLFTDGYADQFGGPKGKKFKYKQLEEKLIEISGLPTKEQKKILEQLYLDWKGSLEQIDDVLLIGVRV